MALFTLLAARPRQQHQLILLPTPLVFVLRQRPLVQTSRVAGREQTLPPIALAVDDAVVPADGLLAAGRRDGQQEPLPRRNAPRRRPCRRT